MIGSFLPNKAYVKKKLGPSSKGICELVKGIPGGAIPTVSLYPSGAV